MISSRLFRTGDRLRYREDLQTGIRYMMVNDHSLDCFTGPNSLGWVGAHKGKEVLIENISPINRYVAEGIACLADTLFAEGVRISRFLSYVDMPDSYITLQGGIEF